MESTSHNSNRVVAALMAVALIWIFWPIISPAMMFLNTIAFLPFNVLYFLVGTIGENILFTVSLGCFLLCIRDIFGRLVTLEQNVVGEGLEEENENELVTEEKHKEKEISHETSFDEEIGDKTPSIKEGALDSDDEKPVEDEGTFIPEVNSPLTVTEEVDEEPFEEKFISSDADLIKSLAAQEVVDAVCQDIIDNKEARDGVNLSVSPSAC